MPKGVQFLHSNSIWDVELTKYMYKMNHAVVEINEKGLQEFHDSLVSVVGKLKKESPNYWFFLSDHGRKRNGSTPHLFVDTPGKFYTRLQEDTSVAKWLNYALSGKAKDIGAEFLSDRKAK
jgi:hypothetical protein